MHCRAQCGRKGARKQVSIAVPCSGQIRNKFFFFFFWRSLQCFATLQLLIMSPLRIRRTRPFHPWLPWESNINRANFFLLPV
jgi:hypothetical protein